MFKKIKRYCKDPYYQVGTLLMKHCPKIMPDKWYLQIMWLNNMGYKIDLKHPKTYNEKLQWLKLYDRNPLYTTLVDKYRVKQYVSDKIGLQFVVPLLAVYNSVNEIDLSTLPNQFVLKCNHDSGSFAICRDKNNFDIESAKRKLDKGLKTDFYKIAREWPYKNVKRCIIAEQYLDAEDGVLCDYKFFCFNGEPKFMYIGADKADEPTSDFYDMDFNHLPIRMVDPNAAVPPLRPQCFEQMKQIASTLSKGIPHVRVDFYCVNNKIYFGEYTFYHMGGFSEVKPSEWNNRLGEYITTI